MAIVLPSAVRVTLSSSTPPGEKDPGFALGEGTPLLVPSLVDDDSDYAEDPLDSADFRPQPLLLRASTPKPHRAANKPLALPDLANLVCGPMNTMPALPPRRARLPRPPRLVLDSGITPYRFYLERNDAMGLIVQYITRQIYAKFPIDMLEQDQEMYPLRPLPQFLVLMLTQMQVTFPVFKIMVLLLFRYINLIYLLRYVNQSNNLMARPDGPMGLQDLLRHLLSGALRLATYYHNRFYRPSRPVPVIDSARWESETGIGSRDVDAVALRMLKTMNGKLHVKEAEMTKLSMELFKFVNAVNHNKQLAV